MNHACDIYLYADVNGGYTCHVAGIKRVSDTPCPPMPKEWSKAPVEELTATLAAQREWVDQSTLAPINLPYDGKSYYNLDRDNMVDTLQMLKDAGYCMPDDLITVLKEEDDDEA